MTQAFNLSQLANSVNSSGQLSGSAVNGTVSSATTATNATNLTGGTCTIGTTQLGAGNASIMKNRIINGAMVIDQRNAGASVTASVTGTGTYTLDRWSYYTTAASKFTVQQNAGAVTPAIGFSNYLGVTSSSAYSISAGELIVLQQKIEGFNVADLGWGTANAKTVTLSFWVYSSLTGTFGGSISGGQSYPFTYSIPVANTWTQINVTIAGSTSGSWGTGNSTSVTLNINLGTGTTFSGTAGSWSNTGYYSATGAVSVVGTNGATFYITGVQLEVGSSATGFEYVNYQTSLANCQRYCYRVDASANGNGQFCMGFIYDASNFYGILPIPTQMRASPSLTTAGSFRVNWAGGGANVSGSVTINQALPNSVWINAPISGGNVGSGADLSSNASTSTALTLSAEL